MKKLHYYEIVDKYDDAHSLYQKLKRKMDLEYCRMQNLKNKAKQNYSNIFNKNDFQKYTKKDILEDQITSIEKLSHNDLLYLSNEEQYKNEMKLKTEELSDALLEHLYELPKIYRKILLHIYKGYTVVDTAKKLGLTKERIRQIREMAMRRLKTNLKMNSRTIESFLY